MSARDVIAAIYAAASVLGVDPDVAASWAGLCVALALRGERGEA